MISASPPGAPTTHPGPQAPRGRSRPPSWSGGAYSCKATRSTSQPANQAPGWSFPGVGDHRRGSPPPCPGRPMTATRRRGGVPKLARHQPAPSPGGYPTTGLLPRSAHRGAHARLGQQAAPIRGDFDGFGRIAGQSPSRGAPHNAPHGRKWEPRPLYRGSASHHCARSPAPRRRVRIPAGTIAAAVAPPFRWRAHPIIRGRASHRGTAKRTAAGAIHAGRVQFGRRAVLRVGRIAGRPPTGSSGSTVFNY